METEVIRRVLIIEDNADSAETIKMLLELQTHTVEVASDGKSGVAFALTFKPDVIICDIGLPGEMDGLEVAETLRKNSEFDSIFLIALSGYGQREDIERSKKAGFDEHLIKPADFDKLLSLVKTKGLV